MSERLHFPGANGQRLVGRLDRPDGQPHAYALFAHCFTCSKDLKALGRISRALANEGIGVVRFDFTGLGESEGDFADTDFSSNLDDLVAAADYMRSELDAPQILVGHSLGGAAVLGAAHRIPGVRAVSTIGAPSEPSHLLRRLGQARSEIERRGQAEVQIAGRTFQIGRQLLVDLEETTLAGRIEELGVPLLIFHSPVDGEVGVEHARRIYEAAKHPKSFVSLDGADHLLLEDPADSEFVARILSAWASRYVKEVAEAAEGDHGVLVARIGERGFRTEIEVRDHRLVADEPEDLGGEDEGPTPYDLLLAALGACTTMTLRMYADRKEWPLEGSEVRLEHAKIHAEDCAHCDTEEGKVDRIIRVVALRGELDEEQRQRLLEIADRCPVHRTLTSEIDIESRLAGSD